MFGANAFGWAYFGEASGEPVGTAPAIKGVHATLVEVRTRIATLLDLRTRTATLSE